MGIVIGCRKGWVSFGVGRKDVRGVPLKQGDQFHSFYANRGKKDL